MIAALKHWAFGYVGSTRPAALMRIGLAIILFYRFCWGGNPRLQQFSVPAAFAMAVVSGLMLIGYRSRLATLAAGLIALGTYEIGWGWLGIRPWYHHHTYFVGAAAVLLSMAPCGRSFSVDHLLAKARAERLGLSPPLEEGNLFAIRLLAILMATLYFFAFWDKTVLANTNSLNTSFLSGARLEQIIAFHYTGSSVVIPPWMHGLAVAASLVVVVLELTLPLLLIRRFQKLWFIALGLTLHLSFYIMLSLSTYSITCIVLYLALLDANLVAGIMAAIGPPPRRVIVTPAPVETG